jgi:conjugative relaxase-like TrwC/TraI family protein
MPGWLPFRPRDRHSCRLVTVRQKANRRIGYDLNFHVPKSVTVLYGLTGDERILSAFKDAVGATMREMESEMKTRVRKGKDAEKGVGGGVGADGNRTTGSMVWGEYVHTTARPVNGEPDPHLHAHCFAFNVTYDPVESRWKAGQFADLKRDAPYFEAVFHATLSKNLADLGLPVERTTRGWEIAGVPRSVLDRFSRRTAQIEEVARNNGVTDAKEKGELGARTRQKKATHLSATDLRTVWGNALRRKSPRGSGRSPSWPSSSRARRAGLRERSPTE